METLLGKLTALLQTPNWILGGRNSKGREKKRRKGKKERLVMGEKRKEIKGRKGSEKERQEKGDKPPPPFQISGYATAR